MDNEPRITVEITGDYKCDCGVECIRGGYQVFWYSTVYVYVGSNEAGCLDIILCLLGCAGSMYAGIDMVSSRKIGDADWLGNTKYISGYCSVRCIKGLDVEST